MTYEQLIDSCHTAPYGRFASDFETEIGRWVNTAYARWWNGYAWPWRVAPEQSLSVVAGTRAYSLPSDYGETWALFDAAGDQLRFLLPADFLRLYSGPDVPSGDPLHFTLMGGQVYLGPTPASSATFKWQYLKRLCHFHSGTATAGSMSDTTDVPIMGWSTTHDDYHYALVAGAQALGLRLVDAPAAQWQARQGMFDEMFLQAVAAFGRAEKGEVGGMSSRLWGEAHDAGHAVRSWL